jgi:hypothetical protein
VIHPISGAAAYATVSDLLTCMDIRLPPQQA